MQIVVKLAWLRQIPVLILAVVSLTQLIMAEHREQKFNQCMARVENAEARLFTIQTEQQQINDTYTQTWAQQNKTGEMIYELGFAVRDNRTLKMLQKNYPNVAQQMEDKKPPHINMNHPFE